MNEIEQAQADHWRAHGMGVSDSSLATTAVRQLAIERLARRDAEEALQQERLWVIALAYWGALMTIAAAWGWLR